MGPIKVVNAGSQSALVAWSPPVDPRGIITMYTVHWNASEDAAHKSKNIGPNINHLRLRDLPQGRTSVSEEVHPNCILQKIIICHYCC